LYVIIPEQSLIAKNKNMKKNHNKHLAPNKDWRRDKRHETKDKYKMANYIKFSRKFSIISKIILNETLGNDSNQNVETVKTGLHLKI
jgi:hypothetical protein